MVGQLYFERIPSLVLHPWLLNSGISVIYNEKTKTIADVWVEGELRISFRRNFDQNVLQSWDDLLVVVQTLELKDGNDSLVWCYQNSRVYSVQSLYTIINYRSVSPVYVPVVWNIVVPPKIQLFLWLLAHNKLATVDNLNRRGMSKPRQCRFCMEEKSIAHLFFGSVVARNVWPYAYDFLGLI
jgi:hypothetical protein